MTRIPINDENDADLQEPGENQAGGQGASGASADGGNDANALRAERDALYERLARATAEYKNSQRRMQADLDQRLQYANSSLIKSVLPVIDNFERALSVDPDKADPRTLLKGMQIVHDQLLAVLRQQNVEEIAPRPGEPFDPAQHEAIMQEEGQYDVPSVTRLLQKGYALQGRTLRPAQVAVSRSS